MVGNWLRANHLFDVSGASLSKEFGLAPSATPWRSTLISRGRGAPALASSRRDRRLLVRDGWTPDDLRTVFE